MDEVQSIRTLIEGVPVYGVVGFAMLATLFPGIPEEIFLLVVGYLVGTGAIEFWYVVFPLIFGMLIMDCILFALSRADLKILVKLQNKLLGDEVGANRQFVARHVNKIVFLSRFALYIRWIGPVLAGSVRVSWRRFLVIDILALSVYVPTVLFLGTYFRARIERIIEGVNIFGNILGVVLVLAVLVALVFWGKKKFKKRLVATVHGEGVKKSFLGFSIKK